MRPGIEPECVRPMKFLDGDSELPRIASDLVQGGKPVVAIERGILQPFGHDRTGHLLELHSKSQYGTRVILRLVAVDFDQQHAPYEIEYSQIGHVAASPSRRYGLLNVAPVFRRNPPFRDVRPVHGKTGNYFR